MKTRLYDDNDRFTSLASELATIARNRGIAAAFEWAREKGCSIREASHVIHGEVLEQELITVLGLEKPT